MIVSMYMAVLGLLFVILSFRVIGARRKARVAIGHGNDPQLERRARVHANFAEYVPLALLLVFALESGGAAAWLLHGLGITLVGARLLHAYGVSQLKENLIFRQIGMVLTFAVIVVAAIAILSKRVMAF